MSFLQTATIICGALAAGLLLFCAGFAISHRGLIRLREPPPPTRWRHNLDGGDSRVGLAVLERLDHLATTLDDIRDTQHQRLHRLDTTDAEKAAPIQ